MEQQLLNESEHTPMGTFEEIKGKAKEVIGDVTDNESLQAEGKFQKEKGEEQREATQARAEAEVHEAKAEAKESAQELAAKTK